jgi:hypothetical protein
MYADSNQCRVIFEAFHMSDSAALIGREGHHNIPALGQDTDRALRVTEEDVARRRAQTGNVRILQTVSFLRTGECGGVTLKMSVFLSASEPSVRVSKKLKCLHCTGELEGTRSGGGYVGERHPWYDGGDGQSLPGDLQITVLYMFNDLKSIFPREFGYNPCTQPAEG